MQVQGGNTSPIRTAASTLSIASSSVNDTSGGTGANTILISGIDANYAAITEIVTLNGQTPVITTSSYRGINRIAVYLSGTGRTNTGNITATHVTDNVTAAYVAASSGVTQQLIYYVPANKTGFIENLRISAAKPTGGTEPETTFYIKVYNPTTNTTYEIGRVIIPQGGSAYSVNHFKLEPLLEKEIIWIEAASTQNDTQIAARMGIILANMTL